MEGVNLLHHDTVAQVVIPCYYAPYPVPFQHILYIIRYKVQPVLMAWMYLHNYAVVGSVEAKGRLGEVFGNKYDPKSLLVRKQGLLVLHKVYVLGTAHLCYNLQGILCPPYERIQGFTKLHFPPPVELLQDPCGSVAWKEVLPLYDVEAVYLVLC